MATIEYMLGGEDAQEVLGGTRRQICLMRLMIPGCFHISAMVKLMERYQTVGGFRC